MQAKVDLLLERLVSFRLCQQKMCKELGFDYSRETYLKSKNSISILLDVNKEYYLVLLMEMNALKVEFFDCDQYVTTIDDLVVNLLEVLETIGNNQVWGINLT